MRKNINLMKEANLKLLRRIMKQRRKATKPQLAEWSGLSVVTVSSLMKVLLSRGEVMEDETALSNGGRPPLSYRFNAGYKLALVIYMLESAGNDIAVFSVDNLWGEHLERTEKILNQKQFGSFTSMIEGFIAKYPKIGVIAFGMPGVELQGKLDIIDYKDLQGKEFCGYFRKKFYLPVLFENDINAAVMGFCEANRIKEGECVVAVYYPCKYPPGAGIFINGQIYKGRDGFAGEIKYLPIGVDWQGLGASLCSWTDAAAKIILSIISLYNPHQIVLYGENLPENLFSEILGRCEMYFPHKVLPKFVVSKNFHHDFAVGIQKLALQFLNDGITVKDERGF